MLKAECFVASNTGWIPPHEHILLCCLVSSAAAERERGNGKPVSLLFNVTVLGILLTSFTLSVRLAVRCNLPSFERRLSKCLFQAPSSFLDFNSKLCGKQKCFLIRCLTAGYYDMPQCTFLN